MEPASRASFGEPGGETRLNPGEPCVSSVFTHHTVFLEEVLSVLQPRDGASYFDGTCGGAGHSVAILKASGPKGFLYACDADPDAIAAARERLAPFEGRHELRMINFADAGSFVPAGSCAGALLDLGVSSHQLDTAMRGFSFQQEGPLDMRMSPAYPLTAAMVVNTWPVEDLTRLFWDNGENHGRRIARAIDRDRQMRPFETTRQLAATVARANPRAGRAKDPSTLVFQALRIVVNDERGALDRGLQAAWDCLAPGGVLAVITFHSGEDRQVKEFFRVEARDYDLPKGEDDLPHLRQPRPARGRFVTRKAILPSEEEQRRNPRSRSAQLRALVKL